MLSIQISDIKDFMSHLLSKDTFDHFYFIEASIKMGVSYQIQGRINEGFYDTSVEQTLNREFCYWKEIRHRIFDIIKGKPLSIERREDKMVLIMEDRELAAGGIFVLRESMKPAQLVPGIKIEDNKVITDKSMASNIKGLYAAGDITGVPYQYVKAAGEGNVAALSAVGYLAALNRAGK